MVLLLSTCNSELCDKAGILDIDVDKFQNRLDSFVDVVLEKNINFHKELESVSRSQGPDKVRSQDLRYKPQPLQTPQAPVWVNLRGAKCSITILKSNCEYVFILDRMFDAFHEVTKGLVSVASHRLQSS